LGLLLVLANIPTAVIGLLFESTFEQFFSMPWIVGIALLVTGALLWLLKPSSGRDSGATEVGIAHAVLLGCIQGLAITPGISRSGSTIAVALLCGVSRESAARFSFLMAIPAILGAAMLKSDNVSTLSIAELYLVMVGMLSALVVGYIALRYLIRLVMQGELWRFAFYCWAVGLTTIVFAR
jgi:undecaprenyl-diphosphatase